MKLNINSDLLRGLLKGEAIIETIWLENNWYILTKRGDSFTVYKTDDYMDFKPIKHYRGQAYPIRKKFIADFDPDGEGDYVVSEEG